MDKATLAKELRQRQRDYGAVPTREIDRLSDDEMIDCYTVCGCCGEPQVGRQQLFLIIARSRDAEDFLARLGGER